MKLKTVNPDPTVKFNVVGVRKMLKTAGFTSDFIYNDGSTLVVQAGYGKEGLKRADIFTELFPFWDSRVSTSDRLGSSEQRAAWAARDEDKQHFVCFTLPLAQPLTAV